jgi:O-antigen ligase
MATALAVIGLHYHLTKSLVHVAGLLALIAVIVEYVKHRSLPVAVSTEQKTYALTLLAASAMVFASASSGAEPTTERLIDSYAIPALCLAFVALALRPPALHWLEWLLPASLLAMALPGVIDFLRQDSLTYRTDGNLNMPLIYATCLAMMLVATCASLALSHQRRQWPFMATNVVALMVGGSALVMTGGRGPMLAVGLTLLLFFIILGLRFLRWRTAAGIALVVSLLAAGAISQSHLPHRFSLAYEEVKSGNMAYSSSGLRLLMWQGAIEIVRQQPLTGVGIGHHNAFLKQENADGEPILHPRATVFDHLHNDSLNTLAWFGIPRAALYLLPIWLPLFIFARRLKCRRESQALIGLLVCVCFLLSGITNTPSVRAASCSLYWLIVILCLAKPQVPTKPAR